MRFINLKNNMKILYLLPPSEWKNSWWISWKEQLIFRYEKPLSIAENATEKDLKCTGKRYEEAQNLNKNISHAKELLPAIERYSGVMYNAISYTTMNEDAKKYFQNNFLVLSGMYGLLFPHDIIWDYKLPIETKGLKDFWGTQITDSLNSLDVGLIVDFLPNSYKKMIQWKHLSIPVLQIDFFTHKSWELKKMTHGVKKVKWEFIHSLCITPPKSLKDFWKKIVQISEKQYHLAVISD